MLNTPKTNDFRANRAPHGEELCRKNSKEAENAFVSGADAMWVSFLFSMVAQTWAWLR